MRDLDLSVDGELFRVRERRQPGGAISYDFAWRNGPAQGGYGFTASFGGDATDDRLAVEARAFVTAFYGPGGIGETDFPDHVAAADR
ncbi:hypothetical protein GCM10027413_13400 [Conyzicola nivalis]|uniref:Uncharacterized protein n=1 Tax=Conyzicola nivalis TaxID=1477021 RepID=A0A916SHC2_9MICO|nr:hypothetical protein [Conyzicola nivalis]GGB00096.1 hypothetical protein GCM10010979_13230 [Conyzicola nivalis]